MTDGDNPGLAETTLPEDEQLLADLRDAGRLDPVPASAVFAARSSFAWRSLDSELAALRYDSLLDDRALAGIRSAEPPPRLLTFEAPALTVEVEASANGTRRRLIGQLVPAQAARLEVRQREGTITTEVDELGRFAVDDLAPGPVSLHVEASAETTVAVTTDWFVA